jgi:hypothetical protein
VFRIGDRLPIGIEAFPTEPASSARFLTPKPVAGDTLRDRGDGLELPTDWANEGVPPEPILVELILDARAAANSYEDPPAFRHEQVHGRADAAPG